MEWVDPKGDSDMRRYLLATTMVVIFAVGALAGAFIANPTSGEAQGSCGDWLQQTSDRVGEARFILYPANRSGGTGRSAEQDAQILLQMADEQYQSNYPEGAVELNDDLAEAFTTGASGLGGAGGAAPETQITFAKAIVYNADARLIAVSESC